MLTAFRWSLRLLAAVLVLTAGAGVIAYVFAARSLPDYSATHRLPGLSAPVEIVRTTHNVPHIFGETDEDVFFALGLAHAQDRLWQMILLRRTAQGRLSEVFGPVTLRTDELMRRLDFHTLALASVDVQDAETQAMLRSYARGVNAWIGQVNEGALGRGAPELFLFPQEIAFWQPADSIAIMRLMAFTLSSHVQTEVLRARLSQLMPAERVADLMPDAPGPGVAVLPDFASLLPWGDAETHHASAAIDPEVLALLAAAPGGPGDPGPAHPFDPVPERGVGHGSNAWAAAPSRSAAGGTLLANDPHLPFQAPGQWYLARLELSSGGVIGATVPGIPLVLIGRSEHIAWGLTASYLDDQDVMIERLNPENPEEYLTPDGWRPFETRRAVVQAAGAPPLTLTLRWTENGPVLPGTHFDLGTITPPGHVAALAWTALRPDDTSMTAAHRLMRSGSVEEALAAGELHVAPSQNLIVGDRERIAMQLVGAMPRRDPAHQTQGRMPAPGWRAENRWNGFFPYSANPRFLDPSTGMLGNTNNMPLLRPFPLHVSFDWGDTQRIRRWLRLMQIREVHSRDSFVEAQLDTVSVAARTLLPLIGAELWFSGEPAPAGSREARRQEALRLLSEWNGEMNEHMPEPLIYAAWMRALQQRLIRDEIGSLAERFQRVEPVFLERVFRDTDGASAWCDIIQTAATESCTDIASLALDEALLRLSERYGPSPTSWRWGDAHEARHDHAALGQIGLLRYFVNIRQSLSGGDHTLMMAMTAAVDPDPFHAIIGPGYRGVYDFADPDGSVFIIAPGQSGHPLSRHYDDLGELWRRGEYIPMSLDPDLARAAAVGITRLVPRAE